MKKATKEEKKYMKLTIGFALGEISEEEYSRKTEKLWKARQKISTLLVAYILKGLAFSLDSIEKRIEALESQLKKQDKPASRGL